MPQSLGRAGWLALSEAVVRWIAGIDEDDVRPTAERAREWLEDSIHRGEPFATPPSYFAVICNESLALATWIAGGDPRPHFREVLPLHRAAWDALGSKPSDEEMREEYLPGYVRGCCAAREFAAGAEACERHGGRQLDSEDDVQTPLELAAWICRQGEDVDPPFHAMTAARVLREPLADWVANGHGVTAGLWIELVFFEFGPHRSASEAFRVARKFVAG